MKWLRRRLTRRATTGGPKAVVEAGQEEHRPTVLWRCWQAVRGCFCVGRRCQQIGSLEYWDTNELVDYIRWLTCQGSHVAMASHPCFYIGSKESSLCNWQNEVGAGSCLNGEELQEGAQPRDVLYIGSRSSSLASEESDAGTWDCLSSQETQQAVRPRPIFYNGSESSSLASSESAGDAEDCIAHQLPQDTMTQHATFYIGSDTSSLESFYGPTSAGGCR